MRLAAIGAAIPAVVFVAALAGTYLAEGSGDEEVEARLLVSVQSEGPLPVASIVELRIDGSSPRPVTSPPRDAASAVDHQPDWSTRAGRLVFARETYSGDGTGTAPKLYSQQDGAAPTRLTEGLDVDRYPAWSPDGETIAFSRDVGGAFELHVIGADGSDLRQLTRDSARAEEYPSWSPDGRRLAFRSAARDDGDLRVMDVDGSGTESLTQGPGDDSAPAWSPDGRSVAFVRDGSVHLIDPDGSSTRRLTSGPERFAEPSWSPDGRWLAFTEEETGSLFVIRPDGTGLRRVPTDGIVLSGVTWRGT